MTQKCLWRGVLIVVLSVALATPAKASGYPSGGAIAGAIVGVIAAVVVITVVVIHESSKKRTITGCVNSGESGMSVTDEKDKRIYALSGNTAGIKPGDRITLQGKKIKPKGTDKNVCLGSKKGNQGLRRLSALGVVSMRRSATRWRRTKEMYLGTEGQVTPGQRPLAIRTARQTFASLPSSAPLIRG